jgi:hypothetical protein
MVDIDLAPDFRWASPVLDLLHSPHDGFGMRLSDAQRSHGFAPFRQFQTAYDGYPLATVSVLRARSSDRQQYQLATEA